MNPELLKVLLPLFLNLITELHNDFQRMPTLDEANAKLDEDLTKFIMVGDQWLLAHPQNGDSN